MRTLLLIAALALPLSLNSCGGGGTTDPKALTDEGYTALNSGDYKTALESFGNALDAMDDGHKQYKRAFMGSMEAMAHVDPASLAGDRFIADAKRLSLAAKDYHKIAKALEGAKSYGNACAVLDAGLKEFEGDEALAALLTDFKEKAAADPALAGALADLGYL